ncbi:N-6 DNA methylase [Campylobacter vulpis]|nr:N-6 DNA methylase [Campylobacter vulpis]
MSRLLARLVSYGKKSVNKVYDPACGSGSLLMKI